MVERLMRLGMLGMWHTHADGIVRQVAAHPDEFTLVGFYDPDPAVVARRRSEWGPRVPGFRVFERPEPLVAEPLDGVVVEGRVYENLALAEMALAAGRAVVLYPLFHPAAALYTPSMLEILERDIARLPKLLGAGEVLGGDVVATEPVPGRETRQPVQLGLF